MTAPGGNKERRPLDGFYSDPPNGFDFYDPQGLAVFVRHLVHHVPRVFRAILALNTGRKAIIAFCFALPIIGAQLLGELHHATPLVAPIQGAAPNPPPVRDDRVLSGPDRLLARFGW